MAEKEVLVTLENCQKLVGKKVMIVLSEDEEKPSEISSLAKDEKIPEGSKIDSFESNEQLTEDKKNAKDDQIIKGDEKPTDSKPEKAPGSAEEIESKKSPKKRIKPKSDKEKQLEKDNEKLNVNDEEISGIENQIPKNELPVEKLTKVEVLEKPSGFGVEDPNVNMGKTRENEDLDQKNGVEDPNLKIEKPTEVENTKIVIPAEKPSGAEDPSLKQVVGASNLKDGAILTGDEGKEKSTEAIDTNINNLNPSTTPDEKKVAAKNLKSKTSKEKSSQKIPENPENESGDKEAINANELVASKDESDTSNQSKSGSQVGLASVEPTDPPGEVIAAKKTRSKTESKGKSDKTISKSQQLEATESEEMINPSVIDGAAIDEFNGQKSDQLVEVTQILQDPTSTITIDTLLESSNLNRAGEIELNTLDLKSNHEEPTVVPSGPSLEENNPPTDLTTEKKENTAMLLDKDKPKKAVVKKSNDKKLKLKKGIHKMEEESTAEVAPEVEPEEVKAISTDEVLDPDSVDSKLEEVKVEESLDEPKEELPNGAENGLEPEPEVQAEVAEAGVAIDEKQLEVAVEDAQPEVVVEATPAEAKIEEILAEDLPVQVQVADEVPSEGPLVDSVVEEPKMEAPGVEETGPEEVTIEPEVVVEESKVETFEDLVEPPQSLEGVQSSPVVDKKVEIEPEPELPPVPLPEVIVEDSADVVIEQFAEKAKVEEEVKAEPETEESKEPGKSEISNELEQESVKPEELKGSDQLDDNQYLKEETLQQPITEKEDYVVKSASGLATIPDEAPTSQVTLQAPKQDYTPKATKSDSDHQPGVLTSSFPSEDDANRGRYHRHRSPFHEGDLMSRSAFDETRACPRVKTLEEILASITVTAREVLSYRKKRTARSMVTEARIRYAF